MRNSNKWKIVLDETIDEWCEHLARRTLSTHLKTKNNERKWAKCGFVALKFIEYVTFTQPKFLLLIRCICNLHCTTLPESFTWLIFFSGIEHFNYSTCFGINAFHVIRIMTLQHNQYSVFSFAINLTCSNNVLANMRVYLSEPYSESNFQYENLSNNIHYQSTV